MSIHIDFDNLHIKFNYWREIPIVNEFFFTNEGYRCENASDMFLEYIKNSYEINIQLTYSTIFECRQGIVGFGIVNMLTFVTASDLNLFILTFM